ncbi:MAG: hypothetical protein JRD89_10745 [Deltaproteobacteria bacterium]|nr:hypothetical protein [Deltaproteobacteria bacterium]
MSRRSAATEMKPYVALNPLTGSAGELAGPVPAVAATGAAALYEPAAVCRRAGLVQYVGRPCDSPHNVLAK